MTKLNSKNQYHYIYKTTHLNGKYYVGRHSTNNLNRKYLGSGKWVRGIKDKTTLTNEIIEYYNTYEELLIAEQLLIEKHWDNPNCMNMLNSSVGGVPGNKSYWYGKTGDKHPNFGRSMKDEQKQKISLSLSGSRNPQYGKTGELSPNYGKKLTEEHKRNISNAAIGHIVTPECKQKLSNSKIGEKNPQSILTVQQVKEIKIKLKYGVRNIDLVKYYGVNTSTISDIKAGRTWSYVAI